MDCSDRFPLFRLPDLVLRMILKDYVPASTKTAVLQTLPEFAPYLDQAGYWLPDDYARFQVLRTLAPGFYFHPPTRDLYHVSASADWSLTIRHVKTWTPHRQFLYHAQATRTDLASGLAAWAHGATYLGEGRLYFYGFRPYAFFLVTGDTVRWGPRRRDLLPVVNGTCHFPQAASAHDPVRCTWEGQRATVQFRYASHVFGEPSALTFPTDHVTLTLRDPEKAEVRYEGYEDLYQYPWLAELVG